MSDIQKQPKASALGRILGGLTGGKAKAHQARLEAFLGAFPGEYCGWGKDGSLAYSAGFCDMLGLSQINTLSDIQAQLSAQDAASLESLCGRLRDQGIKFSTTLTSKNGDQNLRFSGARGHDLGGAQHFDVLWIEDRTADNRTAKLRHDKKSEQHKRLQLLESALETLSWPTWMRDAQGKIIWCNAAYCAALDTDMADILNNSRELLQAGRTKKGEEEKLSGLELAEKARKSGDPQTTNTHIIIGGKRLYMRFREAPIIGSTTPEDTMTLGSAEDITAQEEIQKDLLRYRATNQELLEQLTTAIGLYNSDQQLEFYNPAFAQLWDLEEGWLNKRPKLAEVMEKLRETRRLPEQANFKAFKQSWLDMFTTLIEAHEEMLYLPDGKALRMLVVPQSSGGLMMTFEDVSSRLALESSYNTLIAVQKETLDNLGEAVAVYGSDGRLKLWNPAFSRLWRLNPEDLENNPHISRVVEKMKDFFSPEEWEERRTELISKGLDRGLHEGRHKRINKTLVDYTTVPLPDGGVLVTYNDVTDSVRVENALREKNSALQAAEQLKADFLANVSYQLRTPLNAIMGFNEILQQEYFGPLNTRQKEYIHDIGDSGARLLRLINDILDLSTIEAGYMVLQKESFKVKEVMAGVEDIMAEWAKKKRLKFSLTCPANIGELEADRRRIKQAIINVIRNAITFTPSGGELTVKASRKKDGIEITVSDTGIGISRDNQMRIFKPFERAQRGEEEQNAPKKKQQTPEQGGIGVGLSLVKNIMNLHEGTIELNSEPNHGTTVRLFIPFPKKTKLDVTKMKTAVKTHYYRS